MTATTSPLIPLAALGLVSCAPQAGPGQAATAAVGVGETVDCINQDQIVRRYPAGNNAIIFEMVGGIAYRNDLLSSCPGLERRTAGDAYQFEIKGARLCVNDEVRVFDPIEARAVGTGAFAACRLGRFTQISAP